MSIRPSKSSGRTSRAICANSSGVRMSALGNFIPPFGQYSIALTSAWSSVGAHGPVAGDDVLVERLARPDPEPGPARVHDLERRRGLGDDGGVEPEARAGDPRPQVALGALADGGQHVPHERGLSLRRYPRL